MAQNERFLQYVEAQRKARSLQRAANYVFLGIVIVVLAGSAIGLIPEIEKSRSLDQEVAEWQGKLDNVQGKLQREKNSLTWFGGDPEYLESQYRNRALRMAKPGETLILLSPESIEVYEGKRDRQ